MLGPLAFALFITRFQIIPEERVLAAKATLSELTKGKFAAGSMQKTRPAMTANYDAILIGSGIGALTVAVGLARQKHWRCLILEQNFNLGGMTQEFVRKRRYHFDVGLHYVGEMTPGRSRASSWIT